MVCSPVARCDQVIGECLDPDSHRSFGRGLDDRLLERLCAVRPVRCFLDHPDGLLRLLRRGAAVRSSRRQVTRASDRVDDARGLLRTAGSSVPWREPGPRHSLWAGARQGRVAGLARWSGVVVDPVPWPRRRVFGHRGCALHAGRPGASLQCRVRAQAWPPNAAIANAGHAAAPASRDAACPGGGCPLLGSQCRHSNSAADQDCACDERRVERLAERHRRYQNTHAWRGEQRH